MGEKRQVRIYPVAGLDFAIPHRFHHTSFLVTHIPDPIRLASRNEHVRSEPVDAAVQFLIFVDFEPFRVLDLACLAVVITVFAIDCRIYFGKNEGGCSGNGVRGGARSKEGFPLLKDRGERHLTTGGVHRRLGVVVEVGKSRHISRESRGTGYCKLPLR